MLLIYGFNGLGFRGLGSRVGFTASNYATGCYATLWALEGFRGV